MDTCIKNVSPEAWKRFKLESVHHGMKMGEFFGKMVEEHAAFEKKAEAAWKAIQSGKKTLTDNEAKTMLEASRQFRENFKLCEGR